MLSILSRNFYIGKYFKIPVLVNVSCFIMMLIVGLQVFNVYIDRWPLWQTLLYSLIYPAGIYLSVLIHEYSHALTARRFGINTQAILLFIFGGVAGLESNSKDAKSSFWIAIAGPICSFVLSLISFIILFLLIGTDKDVDFKTLPPQVKFFADMAGINLMLALFNMIPIYPLDGGRVAHAAMWGLLKSETKADNHISKFSKALLILAACLSVILMVSGQVFSGIWFLLIIFLLWMFGKK